MDGLFWFGPSDTDARPIGRWSYGCVLPMELALHRRDKSPDGEVSFVNPFVRAYVFVWKGGTLLPITLLPEYCGLEVASCFFGIIGGYCCQFLCS